MNIIKKEIHSGSGRVIEIETGKLAKQAHGSAVVRCGNTMLLATVVSSYDAKDGVDFLPLSVDYMEKFASAGRIPGGFLKREGRLSDEEVLVCRLIDRALRPLFPSDYHADTQVMIQMISYDENVQPDTLAALAASAALSVSDIPFAGPISEVRVGRIDGEFVIEPSKEQLEQSDIDVVVAATVDNILMVEGLMDEISEAEMLEAMKVAHNEIKLHCQAQIELENEAGKTEKREYSHENNDEDLHKTLEGVFYEPLKALVGEYITDKKLRSGKIAEIKQSYIDSLPEDSEIDLGLVSKYFGKIHKKAVRDHVLDTRVRLDGRQLNEIRKIWGEVDYLPNAHGSALFTRGETQSLTSCTLGTKMDEKLIDNATFRGTSRFLLHYNFPGFSTGEVRPNRGPGRREVGHGNLAWRALSKVIPPREECPYVIRLVSDILESNGSSSMATVCAGTLALMDAGIQIKAPVSGIAMGLITDSETGKFAVLSDILGDEDHLGDMDFKVTGTDKGITACQMDIKVDGLSYEILEQALSQAKEGRHHIKGEMMKVMDASRVNLKDHTPRIEAITIDKDQIGMVIGPGGKIIQEIQAETETTISIEEIDGKGLVQVFSKNAENLDKAMKWVKSIVAVPEVGEVYEGKVKSIMPYGAFVEFMKGKDGLLHVSEIKWERVDDPTQILEEGEDIKVKLIGIDKKSGKFKLSRKALLPKPETVEED